MRLLQRKCEREQRSNVINTPQSSWNTPPQNPILVDDKVDVWQIALDLPADQIQGLYWLLAPAEQYRADRFRFERDRRRFVTARGLLRVILGRYLDLKPSHLRFVYGDHGKPALAPASVAKGLQFNLSHAHALALVAVSRDRQLGIDLEYIRPIQDVEQIAGRILSPQEKGAWRALAGTEKLDAFFGLWTCKEAYTKAKGEGLARPMDQIQVGPVLGNEIALGSVNGDLQEASRWSVRQLRPEPGYVAALVVEGHDWELAQWHYAHPADKGCTMAS